MQKNIQVGLSVLILVVVAAGAFYGGMQYGVQTQTAADAAAQQQRRMRGGGGMFQGGGVAGDILSLDTKSITVKMRGGGSKIVFFSTSTPITKTAPAQVGDLAVGKTVVVRGTQNDDGSVTAEMIQLRPAGGQGN